MKPELFAIEVHQIKKRFGAVQALAGISFNVPESGVFCILGPNGAGKTTLLRILTTVSRPDEGQATLIGYGLTQNPMAIRQHIGVVAQENRFDRYLSVWHNLTMHAQMHGLGRHEAENRISSLLQQVGLYARRNSLAEDLSGGMQRRIALIRALIHRPKILFLDEPSTGLDPQARLDIWNTIEQFKQTATVILTTHYMEEAERLSDRLLLMSNGQKVNEGSSQALKQALSPLNRYEIILRTPTAHTYAPRLSAQSVEVLSDFKLQFQVADPGQLYSVLQPIDPTDLLQFGRVEADLETVFLSLAGSSSTQEDA